MIIHASTHASVIHGAFMVCITVYFPKNAPFVVVNIHQNTKQAFHLCTWTQETQKRVH
jgi:hypothetical protein